MSSASSPNPTKQTYKITNLNLHEQVVHGAKMFQCQQCNYQTNQKASLVTHTQAVHIGRKFQCPDCKYQATQKSSLVTHHKAIHMRFVHMGQKFQSVNIRQETKVTLMYIRKLYI
jgi:uncharacterized Zn-finger protein